MDEKPLTALAWLRSVLPDGLADGIALRAVDSIALATLPLWAPLLLVAAINLLGVSLPRAVRPRGLLAAWAARRVVSLARRALALAGSSAEAPHLGGAPVGAMRRSLSSSLNLVATGGVETALSSAVRSAVTVADYEAFKAYVACMPSRPPASGTGGGEWQRMLEKDTSVMTYRAWRHIRPSGAAEYLSVTVFEGATTQDLLEFFVDDAHRITWDDLLAGYELLEADPRTGAEAVRWVRRFPLMCKPRDYVFTRRSWADGDTFYTITRSCIHSAAPPTARCRRVDDFFSSWRVRPVRGRDGGIACEVVLQHFEEMGIQHDLAKLAVRRGMWGCVQNMERGLCAFAKRRRERLRARNAQRKGVPLSAPRGLPFGGDCEARRSLLTSMLKMGLMAVGGATVVRHSGAVLASAVGRKRGSAAAEVEGECSQLERRHSTT